MAEFRIQIAGFSAGVRSLFMSTRDYCGKYLTDREPDFFVEVLPQELPQEQERYRLEALEEGLKPRRFSDPFLDRSVIQRKIAEALLDRGVLMFHGSAVALDGEGYLFTASCGTGKSTHTRFWREVFGDRAVTVNDDKPFLKYTPEGIFLCGAPWSGKHGLDSNITVPLKGICILERGAENRIWAESFENGAAFLQKQAFLPGDARSRALLGNIAAGTKLWRMECTKTAAAARLAAAFMAGKT